LVEEEPLFREAPSLPRP